MKNLDTYIIERLHITQNSKGREITNKEFTEYNGVDIWQLSEKQEAIEKKHPGMMDKIHNMLMDVIDDVINKDTNKGPFFFNIAENSYTNISCHLWAAAKDNKGRETLVCTIKPNLEKDIWEFYQNVDLIPQYEDLSHKIKNYIEKYSKFQLQLLNFLLLLIILNYINIKTSEYMNNMSLHIISLHSSLISGESFGCMFREGRPSEPSKCSGDMEV